MCKINSQVVCNLIVKAHTYKHGYFNYQNIVGMSESDVLITDTMPLSGFNV